MSSSKTFFELFCEFDQKYRKVIFETFDSFLLFIKRFKVSTIFPQSRIHIYSIILLTIFDSLWKKKWFNLINESSHERIIKKIISSIKIIMDGVRLDNRPSANVICFYRWWSITYIDYAFPTSLIKKLYWRLRAFIDSQNEIIDSYGNRLKERCSIDGR